MCLNVRARTLCSGSGKIITATIFLLLLNKKNLASAGKTFLKNDHYIVDYALIYIYIYMQMVIAFENVSFMICFWLWMGYLVRWRIGFNLWYKIILLLLFFRLMINQLGLLKGYNASRDWSLVLIRSLLLAFVFSYCFW